jgi:folate-binding protein YgfZ
VALTGAQLPDPHACAQRRLGERLVLGAGGPSGRWLEIAPRTAGAPAQAAPCESWRLLEVRAGMAQVYAATSAQFVAQMLNLDVLGAIAFDKGCYTGQEVIARAHYRGRVKRRAQRFCTSGAASLAPGALGGLPDGRTFTVVEAARRPDGRCEFLAVTALPGEPSGADAESPRATVQAEPLELPYALPA